MLMRSSVMYPSRAGPSQDCRSRRRPLCAERYESPAIRSAKYELSMLSPPRWYCYVVPITVSASGGKTEMTDTTFPAEAIGKEAEHRAHLRRAVIASTVGTTIEWY